MKCFVLGIGDRVAKDGQTAVVVPVIEEIAADGMAGFGEKAAVKRTPATAHLVHPAFYVSAVGTIEDLVKFAHVAPLAAL